MPGLAHIKNISLGNGVTLSTYKTYYVSAQNSSKCLPKLFDDKSLQHSSDGSEVTLEQTNMRKIMISQSPSNFVETSILNDEEVV